METDKKRWLFESAPIPKAIATLAIPTIISQLINLVYNTVDTFFIGRTGNSDELAALTIAFTLYMMTIAFSNLCGIGGGSLIARLIGKNELGHAKKVSSFSIYLGIAIAVVYSLLIFIFMDPILRVLKASDNTIGYARQYVLYVVVLGNIPVIMSLTLSHLLRNVGYSNHASIGLSLGGILNIILDPIFMFTVLPSGMEVAGAAIATLISNICSCLYLTTVLLIKSKTSPLSISPKEIKGIRKQDLKELFSVGVPSAILTGLFDVANIFLNALMAMHSDLNVSAIGIVMKAERLPNAINLGICQGMLPIVAFNYSIGNTERMKKVISSVRITGLIIAVVCLVCFELASKPIVSFFLSTSGENVENAVSVLSFAAVYLRIRCLASPVQFLNYHTSYCLQAMGDGRDTLLHAVVRQLGFYIPFMFILDSLFGETGLTSALIVGETLGGIFALFLLNRFIKKRQKQIA